jgi:signal transduction histidine kinase/ActR/RegA family two-component response regulator
MLETTARWLFNSSGLTPHGFCLLWQPGLIWTYTIADIGIGLAYFMIPLELLYFVLRRKDFPFPRLICAFAFFIFLCGVTHWLEVLTLWVPAYGLEALAKLVTAAGSLITAFMSLQLIPRALKFPSNAQIRQASEALRKSEERLYQAQKIEAVGQLTGGIAHDFNNLLQSIRGGLELMERRAAQGRLEEVTSHLDVAKRAVDRASNMTVRLMAFSRQQSLHPEAIEPDKLIRGMRELLQHATGPGVSLDLNLHDGVWSALCDRNQLESALLNLAINARDAMPEGGTIVISSSDLRLQASDLETADDGQPGDYVQISVKDTGSGMPPEVLARAIEPFYTTKELGQGSGLGLSQTYGFVKQSGGIFKLESELGRGTTVRMLLPRHRSADQGARVPEPQATANETEAMGGSYRILVVDDETMIRAVVVESLRDQGCEVIEAESGQAALHVIETLPPIDILVTDVGMPGMTGRQLAAAARRIRPSLPIILITGYAGDALGDLAFEPGIAILAKPFNLEALTALIEEILKRPKSAD